MRAFMVAPAVRDDIEALRQREPLDKLMLRSKIAGYIVSRLMVEVPINDNQGQLDIINKYRERKWTLMSVPETEEERRILLDVLKNFSEEPII